MTPQEMKQLDEILKRLEALEARVTKLEKAPTPAATAPKREVITDSKSTNGNAYYKTSEGRILKASWAYLLELTPCYIRKASQILMECGEEAAVDFSDFSDESLKEAKENNTEEYQKLMKQLIALATKYGAKGNLPALLPNDSLLFSSGSFYRTMISKKAIKF